MNHYNRVAVIISTALLLAPSLAFADFNVDLHYGDSGSEVAKMQQFLAAQSVFTGEVTGNFFGLTLAAVQAFQSAQGISPVSGFWGPLTRARANAVVSAGGSTGSSYSQSGSSTQVSELQQLLAQITALQAQISALKSSSSNTTSTAASCWFNGSAIASGSSVTAYQASSVASGSQCVSETRTCNNGSLSGSYTNTSCSVATAATASCDDGASLITKATAERDGLKAQVDYYYGQFVYNFAQAEYYAQGTTYWNAQATVLANSAPGLGVTLSTNIPPGMFLMGGVTGPDSRPSKVVAASTFDSSNLCAAAKTQLATVVAQRDARRVEADSYFDWFNYYLSHTTYYVASYYYWSNIYEQYVQAYKAAGKPAPGPMGFTYVPSRTFPATVD